MPPHFFIMNTNADLSALMRNAMRKVAGTVSVITTYSEVGDMAVTATAFSSLSLSPPAILICLNKDLQISNAIKSSKKFNLNILGVDHSAISMACGGGLKGEEKFKVGSWCRGHDCSPYIEDAEAVIECDLDGNYQYGSHEIFIGKVTSVRNKDSANPLVYLNGSYGAVGEIPAKS